MKRLCWGPKYLGSGAFMDEECGVRGSISEISKPIRSVHSPSLSTCLTSPLCILPESSRIVPVRHDPLPDDPAPDDGQKQLGPAKAGELYRSRGRLVEQGYGSVSTGSQDVDRFHILPIYPATWATVASFVTLGLTWWESCLAIFLGGILVAIVITANGIVGATVHTPFAITSRSVFGYWGSKFVVFSRMVIACFWLSINSWSGGIFVTLMIQAIWPQYADLPNAIPIGQGATSRDFLSFFIFWLLQLPFIFIHPSKLKWLFNVKAVMVPIVCFGTLIWAVRIAGSEVNTALNQLSNRAAPGAPRFIAFCYAVTAAQGTWATLSVNIGDFSRYCRSPQSAYIQLIAMPTIYATMGIFASISAACCYVVYGEALYQPYEIVAKWGTSAGGRAAMFLGSLIWALSNVTTNITANSISAANDLTSLAPKYIDIRRGQMIAVTIGVWGFAPWKVLNSAANFLTFMASYSIVLAPIAALMAFDFFVIKRQKIDIYELYKPRGIYRFARGWNWRAYVALAVAVAPNLPGMVNAIEPRVQIGNIRYIYMLSNVCGDAIALFLYYLLNRFFPAREAQVAEAVHDVKDYREEPDSEESSAVGVVPGDGMFGMSTALGEKDVAKRAQDDVNRKNS